MTKCQLRDREERMDQYLLKKLSAEEAERFEVHVFGCEECLEELRIREQIVKLIRKEPVDRVRIDYSNKPHFKRSWLYAAGVAVAFFLIIFSIRIIQKDSIEINAANFEVNAYLEDVILQTYQSGSFSIDVQSPKIEENFKRDILFKWSVKGDGKMFIGAFDLKIMNNKEAIIYSIEITGNQYELKEGFEPGLYYWVLEENSEMIFLGKFFVKKPDNLFIPPPK